MTTKAVPSNPTPKAAAIFFRSMTETMINVRSGRHRTGRVTMRRHGAARAKALRLAEIDLRPTGFPSLEDRLSDKGLEDGGVGCDSGVDDQVRFPNPAVRRERQLRFAVAAHQIGHAEKPLPQPDDLQMRGLVFFQAEPLAKVTHDIEKQFVQFKFLGGGELQTAIEPSQFGLAFGVY